MDYNYLVPANSKKQGLILGLFNKTDMIILLIGLTITFILLIVLPMNTIWGAAITISIAFVTAFLVFPIPNYHNGRVFMQEAYRFYFVNRRKYVWRGWCYKYEQSDE